MLNISFIFIQSCVNNLEVKNLYIERQISVQKQSLTCQIIKSLQMKLLFKIIYIIKPQTRGSHNLLIPTPLHHLPINTLSNSGRQCPLNSRTNKRINSYFPCLTVNRKKRIHLQSHWYRGNSECLYRNSHDFTPPLSLRWLVAEEPDDDDDQQRQKT